MKYEISNPWVWGTSNAEHKLRYILMHHDMHRKIHSHFFLQSLNLSFLNMSQISAVLESYFNFYTVVRTHSPQHNDTLDIEWTNRTEIKNPDTFKQTCVHILSMVASQMQTIY